MSEPRCLDRHQADNPCAGEVEYRYALTSTSAQHPRCDHHWEQRLDFQDQHNRRYPDSSIAPSWFDPTAAGETWDEDY